MVFHHLLAFTVGWHPARHAMQTAYHAPAARFIRTYAASAITVGVLGFRHSTQDDLVRHGRHGDYGCRVSWLVQNEPCRVLTTTKRRSIPSRQNSRHHPFTRRSLPVWESLSVLPSSRVKVVMDKRLSAVRACSGPIIAQLVVFDIRPNHPVIHYAMDLVIRITQIHSWHHRPGSRIYQAKRRSWMRLMLELV